MSVFSSGSPALLSFVTGDRPFLTLWFISPETCVKVAKRINDFYVRETVNETAGPVCFIYAAISLFRVIHGELQKVHDCQS